MLRFSFPSVSPAEGDGVFFRWVVRVNDGKEYRHRLYTYEEILRIIEKYDLPQNWNDDGKNGPERYIEVQIWTDDVIKKYL